jgi:hypothetical protein
VQEKNTIAIADNGIQGGIKVWPSEATASFIYDIANIAFVASLTVGVIATILVIWMGNVKESYLRQSLATVNKQAAAANERAAQLTLEAEAAKREQERLKSLVIWRAITNDEGNRLVNILARRSGSVTLAYVQVDPEAVSFTAQIKHAFDLANQAAGTVVWNITVAPRIYSNRVVTGLHIPDRGNSASRDIQEAFASAGISFESDDVPPEPVPIGPITAGVVPVTTDAVIVVGSRGPTF